jgi:pyruvate dehydrogenase E1 component beta subunit
LIVVAPGTPYDAKGLLKSSIRNDNPVLFLEAELMYSWQGEVPEEEYLIPIGKADVKREGKDVTFVTYSKPLRMVQQAAERLAEQGIEAEIIDIRTVKPLDEEAIYQSVRKTNRCVIVDETWPFASVASHIGWLVSKNCFDYLDAPVELVTSEDVPMPYNHTLELEVQPTIEKIIRAAQKVLYI